MILIFSTTVTWLPTGVVERPAVVFATKCPEDLSRAEHFDLILLFCQMWWLRRDCRQIRRDTLVGLHLLFIDGDLVLNRVQKWMDRHKKRDQFDWFFRDEEEDEVKLCNGLMHEKESRKVEHF